MKTSLLLLSAISVHLSLSPPNPPVKQHELYCQRSKSTTNTLFEKFIQSITFCSKSMVWLGVLTETLAPAISQWKQNRSPNGIKTHTFDSTLRKELECHPVLVAGVFLTVLGAALRIWCFKKLGPMFTFEITIRPKHELVTSGPYAWVRHPSYMGVYLTLIGATLALGGAPNSWIASKGVWTIPGALLSAFWVIKCAMAFRGTHARLRTEDQVLKEAFGVEWEEYAARVPWKLIPGLF